MGNQHYWVNKEQRAEKAKKHTEEVTKKYENEIINSFNNTKMYYPNFCVLPELIDKKEEMQIIIDEIDSVSAALKYSEQNKKCAVLNFASYKNPGGGFMGGSKAQEECLCHESFLYNVLEKNKEYYEWNNEHKNKALYLNRALYSQNIIFERNEEKAICDVITCAAPNYSAAKKYLNISREENYSVLRSRTKYVLDIAFDNNVDTLILGAWGCGVFSQDPAEVAEIFKEYLSKTHKCFEKVIFAIPESRHDNNLTAFKNAYV